MAKRKSSQDTFYGALILAFAFLLRLGTFRQYWHPKGYWIWNHIETDERIYQALAEQVNGNFWNYTMQGTELLPKLNPGVYDHPLFTHPPVFIYLSWFLEKVLHLPFPLVPVLQSLGTILCARWIAFKLYKDEKTALWAMFLLAICPLSWFVSQKYWMESLLALTVSLQFLALLWALEKNDGKRFFLAGLAIALAYLTKFSAIFALPGVALLYFLRRGKKTKVSEVLLLTLPIVLLGGGWSLFALWKNGVVTTHIVDWDFAKFPFMQQVLARPWYYYFQALVEFSPVYLLAFFPVPKEAWRTRAPLLLWAAVFFVGFTFASQLPIGYQTRYVSTAYPALALATAPVLRQKVRWDAAGFVCVLLLLWGFANGLSYGMFYTPEKIDFDLNALELLQYKMK